MIKSPVKSLEDKIKALDKKNLTKEEERVKSILEKRLKAEKQNANLEFNFGPIPAVPTEGYKNQQEKDQRVLNNYYRKMVYKQDWPIWR